MQITVRKWGNSAAVRIPAALMDAAGLAIDQPVELREEGGRLIIEPTLPRDYDLGELISGITDENRHEPVDLGEPVGRELL